MRLPCKLTKLILQWLKDKYSEYNFTIPYTGEEFATFDCIRIKKAGDILVFLDGSEIEIITYQGAYTGCYPLDPCSPDFFSKIEQQLELKP